MVIHTYRIKIADAIQLRVRGSLETHLVEEAKQAARAKLQREDAFADAVRIEGDEFVVDITDSLEPRI